MKKLSAYLFLILFSFSAPSFADDIRDFQIEGMSIGDSLLDYFTKEEIKKNKQDYFNDNEFSITEIQSEKFKVYDIVQALYKTKDRDFKIYALTGALKCKNNFMICKNYWDKIVAELSELFKNNAKIEEVGTEKHSADSSGKSKITSIYFNFDSGDYAYIEMMDWSKAMKYIDQLSVGFRTNEFGIWLSNKAYK